MLKLAVLLSFLLLPLFSFAKTCTTTLKIDGTIGPATLDYVERGMSRAHVDNCDSVLFLVNTPGGNLQSTRLIVEKILNSPRPVLCLVYPSGGHAGSAGAIILQACHVSGAMSATNIGAATPVMSGGQDVGKDIRKKIMNDTLSWIEGLAELRERNKELAKDMVENATAVDAKTAFEKKMIDTVAQSVEGFLEFSEGKEVSLTEDKKTEVVVGPLRDFDHDIRYKVLELSTDPQFAYMIFMGSLGLLYFELTNPGFVVPGVVGGIGLILSMVSFHKLNVDWAGALLILLGLVLLAAEAIIPAFGALGLSGIVSFIIGGSLLFDPAATGVQLPWSVIIIPAILLGLVSFFFGRMAVQSFKKKKVSSENEFAELEGVVVSTSNGRKGQVELQGETWSFKSKETVSVGDEIVVAKKKGLTLTIKKKLTESHNVSFRNSVICCIPAFFDLQDLAGMGAWGCSSLR